MPTIHERIERIGVVPVIQLSTPERSAAPLAKALTQAGVPIAEITFRTEGAERAIGIMREACPGMLVGAGTVILPSQVDLAKAAGAEFVVSPGFSADVVERALELGLTVYPGCTTPTEIQMALKYGLEVVKFFPAELSGGLPKIRMMSAPLPMVKFMPTGGITLDNLKTYLSFPKVCACGGSFMAPKDKIDNENWDAITALCETCTALVKEARAGA